MMLNVLLLSCVFIWLPILLYFIFTHRWQAFLLWLFIAPVALNVVNSPTQNPFFSPQPEEELNFGSAEGKRSKLPEGGYLADATRIDLNELLAPTRTLVFLLFLIMLLDAIIRRQPLLALDQAEKWMLFFALIALFSAIFQANRQTFAVRVVLDAFITPFLAYFLARRLVTNDKHFRQLIGMLGFLGVYLILIAVFERIDHTYLLHRLRGPFATRDHLYLVLMSIFVMVLIDQHALPKNIRRGLLILAPAVIIATWTRGNYLGFFSGMFCFVFLTRRLVPTSQKLISMGLLLLLIPVIVVTFQALVPSEVIDERLGNERTIYGRLGAWKVQMEAFAERPIFGIGMNNTRDLLASKRIYLGGVLSETHSHNSYIAFCTELGLVGLFAYIALAVSLCKTGMHLWRRQEIRAKWHGAGMIAILAAYLLPPLTSSILYVPLVSHVYIFTCLGAITGLNRQALAKPAALVVRPSPLQSGLSLRSLRHHATINGNGMSPDKRSGF